jgi:ABC-2 type transport system permease protein
MKTFLWCVRREVWEHWGLFFGLPAAVGAVATALIVGTYYSHFEGAITLFTAASAADRAAFAGEIVISKFKYLLLLALALGMTIVFYGAGTLYDDRRDRSNLFWKSLPLSDAKMIGAKVAAALVIAPLFTALCSIAVVVLSLFLMSFIVAFQGINGLSALFGNTALYVMLFKLALLWPVFVLTTLPTLGWIFCLSALVRKLPLVWIIGAPLVIAYPLLSIYSELSETAHTHWIKDDIATRLLMGATPGSWAQLRPSLSKNLAATTTSSYQNAEQIIAQAWQIPKYGDYWLAAAIGLCLIFVAIRLRRWRVDA